MGISRKTKKTKHGVKDIGNNLSKKNSGGYTQNIHKSQEKGMSPKKHWEKLRIGINFTEVENRDHKRVEVWFKLNMFRCNAPVM
jgi:hypothetical protein